MWLNFETLLLQFWLSSLLFWLHSRSCKFFALIFDFSTKSTSCHKRHTVFIIRCRNILFVRYRVKNCKRNLPTPLYYFLCKLKNVKHKIVASTVIPLNSRTWNVWKQAKQLFLSQKENAQCKWHHGTSFPSLEYLFTKRKHVTKALQNGIGFLKFNHVINIVLRSTIANIFYTQFRDEN